MVSTGDPEALCGSSPGCRSMSLPLSFTLGGYSEWMVHQSEYSAVPLAYTYLRRCWPLPFNRVNNPQLYPHPRDATEVDPRGNPTRDSAHSCVCSQLILSNLPCRVWCYFIQLCAVACLWRLNPDNVSTRDNCLISWRSHSHHAYPIISRHHCDTITVSLS
jgi:hypothetical protein